MAFGIEFDVRAASDEFEAEVRKAMPRLEKAAAKAVNNTSDDVLKGLVPVIEEAFDEPTDFTLDAFAATKAKPGRQPSADIYVKAEQNEYLRWHMEGGTRTGGGMYDGLAGSGVIIPGKGALRDLDEHGNFRPGYLEFVEANGGWWMRTRAGDAGLFRRTPYGKVEAVAIATDGVTYRRRLVVDVPIRETVAAKLPGHLAKAFEDTFGK